MCWLCLGDNSKQQKGVETVSPSNLQAQQQTSPASPASKLLGQPTVQRQSQQSNGHNIVEEQGPPPSTSESVEPATPLTRPGQSPGLRPAPASDTDPWANGQTQFVSKKYKKIKKIGTGGFGSVYHAKNRETDEDVAIKFMERGGDIRLIRREIINHSNLCHPQVIQFKEVFLTPSSVGLVMEYAPGGDLFDFIQQNGRLQEDQARWIFQQLTVGVDFCHKKSIINRDLKPENTLVVSRRNQKPLVKICDFGYSKNKEINSLLITKVGTPGYIAPEVLEGGRAHGPPADLWSLGCILYVLLFGRYPFLVDEDLHDTSGSFERTVKKVMSADYTIPQDTPVSPEALNLLRSLLIVSPEKRITVDQMWSDPWFKRDLPKDARYLNDKMMERRAAYQSGKEIDYILQKAQRRETE